jgi:uncharacterized protein YhaN
MLEWLRTFEQWRQKARERAAAAGTAAAAAEECAKFESALRAAMSDDVQAIERLLPVAAQRVKEAAERQGERRELSHNLAAGADRLAELQQQLEELSSRQSAWQAAWSELLAQLALPSDWQAATVAQLVVALDKAVADQRLADDLRGRIGDMEREREAFARDAAQLVAALAPQLAELPLLARVRELAERAAAAQQAQTRLESLAHEHARLERESHSAAQRLAEHQAQRDAMLTSAGAADELALRRLAAGAARRDRLREELRAAQKALGVARQHEDVEAFDQ